MRRLQHLSIISAVRLRDERYLFHLSPWVYFPLYLGAGVALGWLLEDAPFWLQVLVAAPIGWTLPFYIIRMTWFACLTARRWSGTSRWGAGRSDNRWH